MWGGCGSGVRRRQKSGDGGSVLRRRVGTPAQFLLDENVDREHKHTRAEQAEAREEERSAEVVRLVHQPAFRRRRRRRRQRSAEVDK